jgi:hypothetical protein
MIIPETSTSMLKDYLMYNNETVGSLPEERGGDGRGGGGYRGVPTGFDILSWSLSISPL